MEPFIRHATGSDLDDIYDICVRTADAGGDAREQYASERLVGDVYAVPYVVLAPEHAYVVDEGSGRVVGYAVGAADTVDFARRYRDEWIPANADRLPVPPDPPVTPDDIMLWLHHNPQRMLLAELAAYPAHLHIDLLPGWQHRGWGRRLMATLIDGLRAAGAPAVHLAMASHNTGARAFYDRLGFAKIRVPGAGPVTYLGRDTSPL